MSRLTWQRIAGRIKRMPYVGDAVTHGEEWLSDARLRMDTGAQRALRHEQSGIHEPQAILEFARRHFEAGQKTSEILAFAEFARSYTPRVFCEVGTYQSGTHFFLTHALPSVSTTIAIDLLIRNKEKLKLLQKPGQVSVLLEASSRYRTTSRKIEALLAGQPIDLLFIDGDHSYEGVRDDFLAFRGLVREGGLIAFHDICEDYETRYGRKTGQYAGGVPRFWRKLREGFDYREFVDIPEQDGFGIGVIVQAAEARLPRDL